MTKENDDEVLEDFHFRQLDTAEQLKQLIALHIQDTVQEAEPKNYTKYVSCLNYFFFKKKQKNTEETILIS